MSKIAQYIEMPLKFVEWILSHFTPIIFILGLCYGLYKVFQYRDKIAAKINQWRGKIQKKPEKQPNYWDNFIKPQGGMQNGNTNTN